MLPLKATKRPFLPLPRCWCSPVVLGVHSLLAASLLRPPLSSHSCLPSVRACVHISLFFKGRQALDLGPTLIQEDVNLTTSAKTVFPHKVLFTGEGAGGVRTEPFNHNSTLGFYLGILTP